MAPFKLNAKIVKAVLDAITAGATREVAANAAGVHEASVRRWVDIGDMVITERAQPGWTPAKEKRLSAHERFCADLCAGIPRAEAEGELAHIKNVQVTAMGAPTERDKAGNIVRAEVPRDGRLSLEYLARRHPSRWAKRVHVRDETPRTPAPMDGVAVAKLEEVFIDAFGEELPDIDATNLMAMPALEAGEPDES